MLLNFSKLVANLLCGQNELFSAVLFVIGCVLSAQIFRDVFGGEFCFANVTKISC